MAGNWCLIESDPGVFTELIRGFGVKGAQVEELFSLDRDAFEPLLPIHGLIFLFKWRPGDEVSGQLVTDDRNEKIFFAQQAIINLLLNCHHGDIQLGDTLGELASFCQAFDPSDRGLCLSNSEPIRTVHNSFARQQVFEMDDTRSSEREDNYHFVTYMPIDGRVYELDGLLDAPVDLGAIAEGEDWLQTVTPVIQRRIQKYSEGEIHFNLMALISDRKAKFEKELIELVNTGTTEDPRAMECRSLIADEEAKWATCRAENIRRRHNYVPFIVELLKCLADDGKLVPLVKEATEKLRAKEEEEKMKNAVKTSS